MDVQSEQEEQLEQVPQEKNELTNFPGSKIILIGLGIVLILGAAITGGYFLGVKKNEPKACTLEAKQCPDGSYVSRTGPNCEFSPCPTTPTLTPTDQSLNWKTYTNEEYGFSFKYPADFYFEKEVKDNSNSISTYFKHKKYNADQKDTYGKSGWEARNFSIGLKKSDLSLEENIKKIYDLKEFKFGEFKVFELGKNNYIVRISKEKYGDNDFIVIEQAGAGSGHFDYYMKSSNGIMVGTSNGYGENIETITFNQILSTFKFTSAESTPIPSDWTLKQDTVCNVVFPIPPKKAPYYTPDDLDTYSDLAEDGAFWQFQENNEGSSLFAYYKRVLFHNPKAGGSGYIPGLVSVSCSPNENKYTNDILLERYKKTFETASSEIEVSDTKELNLWGRKVYAVYVKGGMFDENNPTYLFATDKHIYSVSKIAMSSNSFVKETAETIFNNLNFKD